MPIEKAMSTATSIRIIWLHLLNYASQVYPIHVVRTKQMEMMIARNFTVVTIGTLTSIVATHGDC